MKIHKLVSIIMTTFNNVDFTMAAIWAIRKHYPDVRIILADGGSNFTCMEVFLKYDKIFKYEFTQVYKGCTEECRNAAFTLVNTPFTIFMDNDTKVLSNDAIEILLNVMTNEKVAQTGAYGVKVADWKNKKAYVGTEFTESMELDASPCTFGLHRTSAYKQVGGMPKEWFYSGLPEVEEKQPGYTGDMTISKHYKKEGWKIMSPNKKIPILHWGQAHRWFEEKGEEKNIIEDWWYKNVNHIKCNPLNNWEKIEYGNNK